MSKKSTVEVFNEQKTRHAQLSERRTRAAVTLESEQRALQEAQAEAVRLFGTSNLEELRALYQQQTQANEQKVATFIAELDSVETQLTDIERQISV